ncbi:hypothetical protein GCM10009740_02530 [Terrabacter terrae]|uniref:Transcriptional regulator WhiB n=1 Tax=Terrabacter terrae TaxID=318434 RepID=A0ABP5F695_9MICO
MRRQAALVALPVLPHVDGPVPRSLALGGWKEHGTCRQTDAELWFAETSRRIHARAASICHDCPVRRPCLTWALVFDEDFGIWGGLGTAERRPLRRRLTRGEPVVVVIDEALSASGSTSDFGSAAGGEVA